MLDDNYVVQGVKLGQKIPPNSWVYGWVNRNLGDNQKNVGLVELLISLRKSVVAGAGFEPAAFGL